NSFHQTTGESPPTVLRCNPDRSDVSCMVRLEQSDNETGHRTVLSNDAVRDGLRSAEKIFKCVAAVGLAIHKTAVIQPPALIKLGDTQRPQIVMSVRWRNQRDVGMDALERRLPAVWPPPRTKFFENCHTRSVLSFPDLRCDGRSRDYIPSSSSR